MRKRKGLGIAPFCIPDGPSMSDPVTHREMQAELDRLRQAIVAIASRLGHTLGAGDLRYVGEMCTPPGERHAEAAHLALRDGR